MFPKPLEQGGIFRLFVQDAADLHLPAREDEKHQAALRAQAAVAPGAQRKVPRPRAALRHQGQTAHLLRDKVVAAQRGGRREPVQPPDQLFQVPEGGGAEPDLIAFHARTCLLYTSRCV